MQQTREGKKSLDEENARISVDQIGASPKICPIRAFLAFQVTLQYRQIPLTVLSTVWGISYAALVRASLKPQASGLDENNNNHHHLSSQNRTIASRQARTMALPVEPVFAPGTDRLS